MPNGLQATIVGNLTYNTLLLNILNNKTTEASICIYNAQGQLVKLNQQQVLQISLNEQNFDVSNLYIGLYTLLFIQIKIQ